MNCKPEDFEICPWSGVHHFSNGCLDLLANILEGHKMLYEMLTDTWHACILFFNSAVKNHVSQVYRKTDRKREHIHTCQVLRKSKSETALAPLIFAYNLVIDCAEKSEAQVLRVRFFPLFK